MLMEEYLGSFKNFKVNKYAKVIPGDLQEVSRIQVAWT